MSATDSSDVGKRVTSKGRKTKIFLLFPLHLNGKEGKKRPKSNRYPQLDEIPRVCVFFLCSAHIYSLLSSAGLRREIYLKKKEFEGGILLFPLSRAAIGGPFSVLCVSESHLSPQCIKIYSFFSSLNTANVELFVSSGLAYLLVQISRDVNRSRTGVNNN